MKTGLFCSLFAIFFLLFSIENPQILRLSRTAGVTMVTFSILEISLMSVYGGYAIGKQKSKPIVNNLVLATIITDIVTHFQLSIMNTNLTVNLQFHFANPEILIITIILQIMVIIFFAYAGNYLYFRINPPEKCLIVTSSQHSLNEIMTKIKKFKKQYKVVEALDYTSNKIMKEILRSDTVFVYDIPNQARTQIVEYCYDNHKNIYYNLELCDIVALGANSIMLEDKPMMAACVKELSFEQRFVKRVMDLTIAAVGVIVSSPIMLVCAIAIKIGDHGPILFTQQRATKDGKIFKVLKFRTMRVATAGTTHVSATADDERITKVGNILRKFRVDELPQLFNILRGEMSVVGPRPEMLENVYRYTEELPQFEYRLRVKAGLTGLAQVLGKYNTSPKDKLVLDLMYIEKYSLWQDIKLLFQTLVVFLKSADSTEGFEEENILEFKKHDNTSS